jgi:hypothetical protein
LEVAVSIPDFPKVTKKVSNFLVTIPSESMEYPMLVKFAYKLTPTNFSTLDLLKILGKKPIFSLWELNFYLSVANKSDDSVKIYILKIFLREIMFTHNWRRSVLEVFSKFLKSNEKNEIVCKEVEDFLVELCYSFVLCNQKKRYNNRNRFLYTVIIKNAFPTITEFFRTQTYRFLKAENAPDWIVKPEEEDDTPVDPQIVEDLEKYSSLIQILKLFPFHHKKLKLLSFDDKKKDEKDEDKKEKKDKKKKKGKKGKKKDKKKSDKEGGEDSS